MGSSYRSIHYGQRPAKNVERKMIAEALGLFDRVVSLESVRYVGFGSIYFADFLLFHRKLGLSPMINIEEDDSPEQQLRFQLNRPFATVELQHGHSSEILPRIGWSVPTIYWLDYDDPVSSAILSDVELVAFNASSPSILIVTVQANPSSLGQVGERIGALRDAIGPDNTPLGVNAEAHLAGWNYAQVSYRVLAAAISRALSTRSRSSDDALQIKWSPLFNFHYEDGTKMVTIGGVLYDDRHQQNLDSCEFARYPYVRTSGDPNDRFLIRIPRLTTRELLHLDRLLPGELPGDSPVDGIPASEVSAYANLYRYFPSFVDVDL